MTDPTSRPATGYPAPQTAANRQTTANGYPQPGTTGTAYPYAAPPHSNYYYQNNNPNPYYYNDPAYAARRATFFRRFFSALIAVFIIFGVILFIIWLVLRPRVPEFQVDSLSLSGLNLSSPSAITANWNVRFTVYNANSKMHVYYDSIEASIYYKSGFLAQNQLAPFDQGTKSSTDVTAELVAASAYVDNRVVSGIRADKGRGTVEFNVKVLAIVRFKAGWWRERRRLLRVYCVDLPVGFSPNAANGTLTGGKRDCAVGV